MSLREAVAGDTMAMLDMVMSKMNRIMHTLEHKNVPSGMVISEIRDDVIPVIEHLRNIEINRALVARGLGKGKGAETGGDDGASDKVAQGLGKGGKGAETGGDDGASDKSGGQGKGKGKGKNKSAGLDEGVAKGKGEGEGKGKDNGKGKNTGAGLDEGVAKGKGEGKDNGEGTGSAGSVGDFWARSGIGPENRHSDFRRRDEPPTPISYRIPAGVQTEFF